MHITFYSFTLLGFDFTHRIDEFKRLFTDEELFEDVDYINRLRADRVDRSEIDEQDLIHQDFDQFVFLLNKKFGLQHSDIGFSFMENRDDEIHRLFFGIDLTHINSSHVEVNSISYGRVRDAYEKMIEYIHLHLSFFGDDITVKLIHAGDLSL